MAIFLILISASFYINPSATTPFTKLSHCTGKITKHRSRRWNARKFTICCIWLSWEWANLTERDSQTLDKEFRTTYIHMGNAEWALTLNVTLFSFRKSFSHLSQYSQFTTSLLLEDEATEQKIKHKRRGKFISNFGDIRRWRNFPAYFYLHFKYFELNFLSRWEISNWIWILSTSFTHFPPVESATTQLKLIAKHSNCVSGE